MKQPTRFYPRLEVDTAPCASVAQAGGVMLTETAAVSGLAGHLRSALAPWRKDLSVHDPAKVLLDLALTVALGGEHLCDVAVLRGEPGLYGLVASDPTISRTIDALAGDVEAALAAIDGARAAARAMAWGLAGADAPDHDADANHPVVIDLDATLITAHSDKESAARTWKKGYGFHPLCAFVDHGAEGTGEPLAISLRAGDAGSNTAADHIAVTRQALAQLPSHKPGVRPGKRVLVRTDGAGATHDFMDYLHTQRVSYSIGYTLPTNTADAMKGRGLRSSCGPGGCWGCTRLRRRRRPLMSEYAGKQFVGIDLHRRRSVVVRTTESGEVLEATQILNDVERLNSVMERAGKDPEVVLEATYGWYWAVDVLQAAGARVHLAHPLGVKAFEYRRVKNDVRDATDLADLLRLGRLPEAWISDPRTRELRELVRHRAKLVGLRSHCKAEIHAVLAKCGIQVLMSDLFSVSGNDLLDRVPLPGAYAARVQSLRRLINDLEVEIDLFIRLTRGRLVADPGYVALQQLPGVGPILASVFLAEVGDVSRFRTAPQLACWAGLTPKHHESDTHVHRGRITKQGSRLVRWAAVESVKRLGPTNVVGAYKKQVADRRGKNIGTVAAARKQTEFVFYALRDHHVRALHPPRPTSGAAA